ncbi:hypothetical protein [Salipiger sp. PrR003]|uniref:hypothetical protein n=1 Tax=Salipiger sp. PrR003 TaxID=2706776 RepID=UPI0013DC4748|nr:hypothetical protein [Salipiger sp. PrR003]NDV50393.1 hypothetical protein [Salipiger sp. PrR003]
MTTIPKTEGQWRALAEQILQGDLDLANLTDSFGGESAEDYVRNEVPIAPLEWEEAPGFLEGQRVWSFDSDQTHWVVKNRDEDKYVWCQNFTPDWFPASPVRGVFDTLEEAIEAAETDWQADIRSALADDAAIQGPKRIAELERSVEALRRQKEEYHTRLQEMEPIAHYGDEARKRDVEALWEQIRTDFPNQVRWATEKAAASWTITIEDGVLFAIAPWGAQYATSGDASPVAVQDGVHTPSRCVNCSHATGGRDARTNWCTLMNQMVFCASVCDEYRSKEVAS